MTGDGTSASARGERWAVATPHPLAADAAARAFEAGGSAVDAALHAATTLAVVAPHQCGAGGDLFALVQNPDGKVVAIGSAGRAPSGVDADRVRATFGPTMPDVGPASVTVPGAVRGWQALHAQGAALPWSDAFEVAAAAADGVPVSRDLAAALADGAEALASDRGAAEVFLAGGIPVEGDHLSQPALAATLRAIADEGPDAIYAGSRTDLLVDGLRTAGVPITREDLANHTAELTPPLRGRYRDLDVLVTPPPSQGFVLLEALAAIERLAIDPDPEGPDVGTLARVVTAASADRDRHLADPDAMAIHVSALLDDGHIGAICDIVRSRGDTHGDGGVEARAAGTDAHDGGTGRVHGDTVALVTADADGWGVSLVQSLYGGFGSGILEPSTGLLLHDRGGCFTLEAGHPNELTPGKRPAHTLMPVLVHREGRPVVVTATRGGHAQPQIDLLTLVRTFDLRLDPEAALRAPRWLVGGMDPIPAEPWVLCEADLPDAAVDRLRDESFRIEATPALDGAVGHAMLLTLDRGVLHAASDPRSDGGAAAG